MIDPILSLAFTVHSSRGIYALLLGSGVSRAASIPTGWEIVLDLVRKLANLRGADCEPDPVAWYKATFGEEPKYSELLEAIAKSPAERSRLLRGYFEPTEDERSRGMKLPTKAHKGIAELVAGGYIRVIVTTNFDRLLENSLESAGIVPTVISTPDAAEGAIPLGQAACTVIKVHGDYLDSRLKNSPAELEQYDPRIERLLDRVFDEFGLVVCGWSGEWDTALRRALERCNTHRFTTYWAVRREIPKTVEPLVSLRRAQVMTIVDAEAFFPEFAEKVFALEDLAKPHPLSAKVALASLKNYLSDDRHRIRAYDLVMNETERVYEKLSEAHFPVQRTPFIEDEFIKRVKAYEAVTEILTFMFVTGCFWGEKLHQPIWEKSLTRIGDLALRNGVKGWLDLKKYPALLLLYAGGLAAVASGRYSTLASLLTGARLREGGEAYPAGLVLHTYEVMDRDSAQWLTDRQGKYYTPLSDYLFRLFREPLREFLPADADYQGCFDRSEYLLALVHFDLREKHKYGFQWAPIGCFGWRHRLDQSERISAEVEQEVAIAGEKWPPLQVGLFDGSLDRLNIAKQGVDTFVARLPWY